MGGVFFGTVDVRSIAEPDLGRTVTEARGILSASGLQKAAWNVPEAASPPSLVDRLAEFGMTPYRRTTVPGAAGIARTRRASRIGPAGGYGAPSEVV